MQFMFFLESKLLLLITEEKKDVTSRQCPSLSFVKMLPGDNSQAIHTGTCELKDSTVTDLNRSSLIKATSKDRFLVLFKSFYILFKCCSCIHGCVVISLCCCWWLHSTVMFYSKCFSVKQFPLSGLFLRVIWISTVGKNNCFTSLQYLHSVCTIRSILFNKCIFQ